MRSEKLAESVVAVVSVGRSDPRGLLAYVSDPAAAAASVSKLFESLSRGVGVATGASADEGKWHR